MQPLGQLLGQRRRSHPALYEVAAEVEPAIAALPRAEPEPKQDLPALERHALGVKDTLGRLVVWSQLQVDRIQKQVDEVVSCPAPIRPGQVALPRLHADAGDCRLGDDRAIEGVLERRLDVPDRQTAQITSASNRAHAQKDSTRHRPRG